MPYVKLNIIPAMFLKFHRDVDIHYLSLKEMYFLITKKKK